MTTEGNVAAGSPVLQPGVTASYGNGWRKLWKNFLELFLVLIIVFAISGVGSWIAKLLVIVSPFYSFLVSVPLSYGLAFAYLKAARGEKVEVKDTFAGFLNYWNTVLAGLLVAVIVIIGFVLVIVPGIVFACKLSFTPYLVMDKKMGVIEAVKESWRMTSGGRSWKVFLIGLLAIPIFIAGAICLGVGVIIAAMWIYLAFASLYHAYSLAGEVKA